MPKIRQVDRHGNVSYVPRNYVQGQPFEWTQTFKSALKTSTENALQISAYERSRGVNCTAIQDSGGDSIEPRVEAAPVQHQSVTWRSITPSAAPGGRFVHAFRDPDSGAVQTVTGSSPIEVINKIKSLAGWNDETKSINRYEGHPVYARYVNSLPLEEGMHGAPAFNQPVPPPVTPGRVLRPGSATYSLPERRAEPPRIVREDFAVWEKTATAKQFQERCKNDSAFLAWANQVSQ